MSYTIEPSENGEYIIMTVKGDINRKTAMQQNQEAHALGKELGVNLYLVDLTEARNTDTVIDQHDFAYKDMRKTAGIDIRAKVALVVAKGDHSHDFIETVSRNAGFNVKLFHDTEQARRFLLRE